MTCALWSKMMVLVEVWFRRFLTCRCGIWRFSSERFIRNRIFLRRPFDWQFLYRRVVSFVSMWISGRDGATQTSNPRDNKQPDSMGPERTKELGIVRSECLKIVRGDSSS